MVHRKQTKQVSGELKQRIVADARAGLSQSRMDRFYRMYRSTVANVTRRYRVNGTTQLSELQDANLSCLPDVYVCF